MVRLCPYCGKNAWNSREEFNVVAILLIMKNEGLKTVAEVNAFLKPFGKKGINLGSYFAGGDQYYHFFHDFKCQHCGKNICTLIEVYLTERGVEWDLVYTAEGKKGVKAIHEEIEQRQMRLAEYEAEQHLKRGVEKS